VSTLSEIAANHAKNTLALEAEAARLSMACISIAQVVAPPSFTALEQMPAHAIAAINEGLHIQTNSYSL